MPQDASTTRDRLVSEACTALGELGLGALTVGTVARRAAVSTALVYYHFDTKDRLILAAAARIVPERSQRRVGALERSGLDALDVLWGVLEREVADGGERAYRELLLHAEGDRKTAALVSEQRNDELAAIAARTPGLLEELGANLTFGAEEFALLLVATLDGLLAALLSGAAAAQVRAAYDAFWLTTISAGQGTGRH